MPPKGLLFPQNKGWKCNFTSDYQYKKGFTICCPLEQFCLVFYANFIYVKMCHVIEVAIELNTAKTRLIFAEN